MIYRPEIDGLRAVAVLSVVLYHAGGLLPGGFVGVDVFFVISGYLITSLIAKDVQTGQFSFLHFYERRIRRLLPALAVTLLASTVTAAFVLMPSDLMTFGRDLGAAVLLIANISLWQNTSYFAAPAELNPLLHLWSLAVEEQFYLVLPAGLVLVGSRWPRLVLPIVVACLLASLWYAEGQVQRGTAKAFFLLHFRAWELLLGSLLALAPPVALGRVQRETVALLGAGAIVLSVVLYSPATAFPGFSALLPCVGAAAIIASCSAGRTVVGELLSAKPAVFVGKVSYGFYLYHWPPLAFAKYYLMRPLTTVEALAIALSAFALSISSLRYVERPYRYGRGGPAMRRFLTAGGLSLVMGTVGYTFLSTKGWPQRLNPEAARLEQFVQTDLQAAYRANICYLHIEFDATKFDPVQCAARTPGAKAVAIWGDSLAAHHYPGFKAVFEGVDILQFTASSCPPIIDYRKRFPVNCRAINAEYFARIIAAKPDVVVLSARWLQHAAALEQLDDTVRRLAEAGVRPVVLGPGPDYAAALPRILAQGAQHGRPVEASLRNFLDRDVQKFDAALKQRYGNRRDVTYLSVTEIVCAAGCPALAGRVPIYVDSNHLTPAGSELYARRLRPYILP